MISLLFALLYIFYFAIGIYIANRYTEKYPISSMFQAAFIICCWPLVTYKALR